MNRLKGSIALFCTLGLYTVGTMAHGAAPTSDSDAVNDKSLTSVILSFFGKDAEKQEKTVSEAIQLEKPSAANQDQYIRLSEPDTTLTFQGAKQPEKKVTVTQSFDVKPSLIFNMGESGIANAPRGTVANYGGWATGNRVTFSYGRPGVISDTRSIELSLGSQFLTEPTSILSPLYEGADFNQINNRQVYNLSFDVGYAGFTLGASFSQERLLHDEGLKGYDIGFGYLGNKWGADLKFGEYKRERDRLFASIEEFYDTTYALELGAAYHLNSNIRFTGRFTYYSYGQDSEIDRLRNSQVFFLGTNVNF
ncbi:hypothetical protein [Paremcibacter congregatus]|uniref:Porin domain-containing protein n=1 Tax=Paremcibacter congregatus TaxID=2043170 RepID=A0A2G4YP58_9PROT|nr:hypothetical protein [Paremcibacter congregatus]PHZ84085.1 hypothetical protein CRD36_12850 [Paremcibacter congregatus]QDE25854.1 hypothetical protein FIV45_00465 [Paremcibacter congregatus]